LTEKEWQELSDPQRMLQHVGDQASQRKLRLLAVACCRRIWRLITDAQALNAVAVAERFADELADEEQLAEACRSVPVAFHTFGPSQYAAMAAWRATMCPLSCHLEALNPAYHAARSEAFQKATAGEARQAADRRGQEELTAQAHLVSEIFGNPFRPLPVQVGWVTPTVRTMAEVTYNERRFADLPILADALEDVGCDNADILNHCRQPGEHVRGCWVVDLLTGRS
jgi:hypothetical protein